MKFLGSYDVLKEKVAQLGMHGEWKELPHGQKQFKARNGSSFSWYETTGKLVFGGTSPEKEKLQENLCPLLEAADGEFIAPAKNGANNRVFVV